MLVVVLGILAGLRPRLTLRSRLPGSSRSCRSWKHPRSRSSRPLRPAADRVEFRTLDGLTLHASLHLPLEARPSVTVIFCPELGGDHWSATWYCRALMEAGFAVLAFDFRNQGQSEKMPGYIPIHWLTEYEVTDTLSAISYVKDASDLRELPIGIFGISRGGSAALVAAARSPEIQCVACEGVFSISTMSLHYTLRWASLYHPPGS